MKRVTVSLTEREQKTVIAVLMTVPFLDSYRHFRRQVGLGCLEALERAWIYERYGIDIGAIRKL